MPAVKAALPEVVALAKALMAPYTGTWALCGGWAIDLWLGRVTREHEDVDIAVWLDEQRLYNTDLADWRLVAHETDEDDHQIPWDGHELAVRVHLHAARDLPPARELLVNERGEGTWTLQRNPMVALPQDRLTLPSPWGIPLMAPEAILFYKMVGDDRPKDRQDLTNVLPILGDRQRAWLHEAIGATKPDHSLLHSLRGPCIRP